MSKGTTEERVKRVVAEYIKADARKLQLATAIDQLGVDSLDKVELVMELEFEYQEEELVIPDEKAERILTIGDAVQIVDVLLAQMVSVKTTTQERTNMYKEVGRLGDVAVYADMLLLHIHVSGQPVLSTRRSNANALAALISKASDA